MRDDSPQTVAPPKVAPISWSSVAQVSLPAPLCATLLILALPIAICAQSIQTIPPRQCVWRAGDNPAWAAPSFDDSAWQPFSAPNSQSLGPHTWVRCHIDPVVFAQSESPAVQIRLGAAYQVFLNGSLIARKGNLRSGNFGLNLIRVFPVPRSLVTGGSNVLALRITRRYADVIGLTAFFRLPQVRLGDRLILSNDRAGLLAGQLPQNLLTCVPFTVIGIVGVVLLGFSLYDRTRMGPIVLSICCIAVGIIFANLLCGTMMANEPIWLFLAVMSITSTVSVGTQYWFPFALIGRRIPLAFWLPIGFPIVFALGTCCWFFVPLPVALRLAAVLPAANLSGVFLASAPLAAFWRWSRVPSSIRPIAVLSLAWGTTQSLFFAALATELVPIPGIPDIFSSWMLPASTITQFFVIAAIIVLNLRDQRQVALHRASLAGEMLAAQEIQRALAPASTDTLPGFHIGIAFMPAREVGGDFYTCGILPGDRQRILLGDVSGKGAAAAMAAAVLLGAVQQHEHDSPAAVLKHLNRVLAGMRLGGFATCLCAEIAANGALTLANAGHLPPYRNGEEIQVDSGLPLGIAPDATYTESAIHPAPGDQLTFLSDGVVEAQNAQGELFGFDRTRQISTQSAQAIAHAAQSFGQQDDITVLTLAFASAEALHA